MFNFSFVYHMDKFQELWSKKNVCFFKKAKGYTLLTQKYNILTKKEKTEKNIVSHEKHIIKNTRTSFSLS